MLFYWYFILCINYCVGQKKTTPDSIESRDCEEDQKNWPVTATPTTDAFLTVRPQIIFFQQNYFDEIGNTLTSVANVIYPAPSFPNLSVTVSTLHIYNTPLLYQKQQLQEFFDGEECCCNFINQDLRFLQPSMVCQMTASNDSQSTASDSTDASILTVVENNPSQEVDSTSSFTLMIALSNDLVNTDYSHTPIQLVEPAPI